MGFSEESGRGKDKNSFSILLDSYDIFERIGKGGGGDVYRAYHRRLQKQVVVKVLCSDGKRGRIEADILKGLKSPYLPQVYDILESGNLVFTVMEFICGKSLGALMRCGRIFTEKQVYQWALELSEALIYLHSQSPAVIHADIKPDNIMLKEDGGICLIDFNVSAVCGSGSIEVYGGTRGYAAPEQVIGMDPGYMGSLEGAEESTQLLGFTFRRAVEVDCRADIYSLGAVLCHLITGTKPQNFNGNYRPAAMKYFKDYDGFNLILRKAMEPDRQKRFQSAMELKDALLHIGRMDNRYRRLNQRKKQIIFFLGASCFLSAILAAGGYRALKQERWDSYRDLIARMEEQRLRGDYMEMEILYDKAVRMESERDEAGILMARSYKDRGKYQEGISYIKKNLLYRSFRKREAKDRVFAILGHCSFQLGDYEDAAAYFKMAMDKKPHEEEYTVGCTIAYIYMGELKKAEEMMRRPEITGMSRSIIQGEIYFSRRDYRNASESFLSCTERIGMKETEDQRVRAWRMAAEAFRAMGQPDDEIETLISAKSAVPYIYQPEIMGQLAGAYIRRQNTGHTGSDFEMAAGELEEMMKRGRASYDDAMTLSLLYQRIGRYSEAFRCLSDMLLLYGKHYKIYKRLAFLEADKQSRTEQNERDYKEFQFYCTEALERYPEENGYSDPDMEVLKELYSGIERGGWLSGMRGNE